jgi:hypothetical protein
MPERALDGFTDRPQMPFNETVTGGITDHVQLRELIVDRQVIGLTQYDLQTNASIDDRMAGSGDAISAGWIMSLELSPFEDRGTG